MPLDMFLSISIIPLRPIGTGLEAASCTGFAGFFVVVSGKVDKNSKAVITVD